MSKTIIKCINIFVVVQQKWHNLLIFLVSLVVFCNSNKSEAIHPDKLNLIRVDATHPLPTDLSGQKYKPSEILYIVDIDGALTKDSDPIQKKRPRTDIVEHIKEAKKQGFNVVVSSASIHFDSDPNRRLTVNEEKYLKEPDVRGSLGWLEDVGLANVLGVKKTKNHKLKKTKIKNNETGKNVVLEYYKEGDAISARVEREKEFTNKALAPLMYLNKKKLKAIKKIVFLDDQSINYVHFQNDLNEYDPYPSLEEVDYYLIEHPKSDVDEKYAEEKEGNQDCQTNSISPILSSCERDTRNIANHLALEENKNLESKSTNHLLEDINFDPESEECQNWSRAHLILCGEEEYEVAKNILKAVQYIGINQLAKTLDKSLEQAFNSIGDDPFVVIIDPKKSSEWLMKQFSDKFRGKKYEVVNSNEMEAYLNTHPNMKHFVRMDDGIYSGEQMSRFVKSLNEMLVQQNRNGTIHVAVPYATLDGRKRVAKAQTENLRVNLYQVQTLRGIRVQIPVKYHSALYKMYEAAGDKLAIPKVEDRLERLTLSFFRHKLPDALSSLEPLIRDGIVKCKDGKTKIGKNSNYPYEFNCIPYIVPPYKEKEEFNRTTNVCKNGGEEIPEDACEEFKKDQAEIRKLISERFNKRSKWFSK